MKRIAIIGSSGAGKSTLARRLGEITGIPIIHLDQVYWRANWLEPAKDEWQKLLAEFLSDDSWIIDGNFGGTMETRIEACDTAIFLDLPRTVCIYRVIKRWLKYRNTNRPDMTKGCNEKIDLKFLLWIWNYPKYNKPKVEEKLRRFEEVKGIVRLRSNQEIEKFVLNLSKIQ